MTPNMGTADRVLRSLLAIGVAVLYFTGRISGTIAMVLGAFAVVFLLTSVIAWCPIYAPLGISSRRR